MFVILLNIAFALLAIIPVSQRDVSFYVCPFPGHNDRCFLQTGTKGERREGGEGGEGKGERGEGGEGKGERGR